MNSNSRFEIRHNGYEDDNNSSSTKEMTKQEEELLKKKEPLRDTAEPELKPIDNSKPSSLPRSVVASSYLKKTYDFIEPLAKCMEDLSEQFCDFDGDYEFERQQFARHLLWKLMSYEKEIGRVIRHHASAYEFDYLWIFLFFYLTGEEPKTITAFDGRLVQFSYSMFKLMEKMFVKHNISFEMAMEKVMKMVDKMKAVQEVTGK